MGKKKIQIDEKGSFAYFYTFVVLGIILIFLFAVGIPLMQVANVEFYAAGEQIINSSQNTTSEIRDVNARTTIQSAYNAQLDSIEGQVDVLSVFFQYGWIIIIFIIALVLFLASRQQVEFGGLR